MTRRPLRTWAGKWDPVTRRAERAGPTERTVRRSGANGPRERGDPDGREERGDQDEHDERDEQNNLCERDEVSAHGGRGEGGGVRGGGKQQTVLPVCFSLAVRSVSRRRVGRSVRARSRMSARNSRGVKPPRRTTGITFECWRAFMRQSNQNPKHAEPRSCPQAEHLRHCRDLQSDARTAQLSRPMQKIWLHTAAA